MPVPKVRGGERTRKLDGTWRKKRSDTGKKRFKRGNRMSEMNEVEEIIIPTNLNTLLTDIADGRHGYNLSSPWKYSEESLGVVVPILRDNPPDRQYTTMYEVLKDLNMKDTGYINQVELQNKTGMAVFIRAGTIFTGRTQNRASQHSGVYSNEKEIVEVRCVHASHTINRGEDMKFGDISPSSVTMNLMSGNQEDVWSSVRNYTGGTGTRARQYGSGGSTHHFSARRKDTLHPYNLFGASHAASLRETGSDNLLGRLQEKQSVIDDMMQKVPLFPDQVGAIIFNPVGIVAVEIFDHPKSWEAIKKEIIEKYGDKIKETQTEHLFELKPEVIPKKFREFIETPFNEMMVRKDSYSETRKVTGKGVVGEYTIVKGQPIHVLLLKEEKNNT